MEIEEDGLDVLIEIVGATNLYEPDVAQSSMRDLLVGTLEDTTNVKPANAMVVVSTLTCDETVVLHKTRCKRQDCHPIWTIHDDCLFVLKMNARQAPLKLDVMHVDLYQQKSISIGQATVDPLSLLTSSSSQRMELALQPPDDGMILNATQLLLQQQQSSSLFEFQRVASDSIKNSFCVNSPKISIRVRVASDEDLLFCKHLKELKQAGISNLKKIPTPYQNLLPSTNRNKKKIAKCITEQDEVGVGYRGVMDAMTSVVHQLSPKSITQRRNQVKVKPGPDPSRIKETTFMTDEQMNKEMQKPSTAWVRCANHNDKGLGEVYLEILNCQGLPNLDVGVGNKTDSFVVAILEDSMMQTCVIDDILCPMWMPWTQRAFIFTQKKSTSPLYLSVFDYDFGTSHEGIGRVVIPLSTLAPNVVHVLQYNLYPSSNTTDRPSNLGTITIRLRRTIHSERAYLLSPLLSDKKENTFYINATKLKTLQVMNYTLWGEHDPHKFNLTLLRSYINELRECKNDTLYSIQNALHSIFFWKGQVRLPFTTNIYIPLHSLIAYISALYLVDHPHLLPGCFFLSISWVLLINLSHKCEHPSPWHRVHTTLYHFFSIVMYDSRPLEYVRIHGKQGWKETQEYQQHWINRMENDAMKQEQQQQQEQQLIQEQEQLLEQYQAEEMCTKENDPALKTPLEIVMDSVSPYLFPVQLKLASMCRSKRIIHAILTWNDPLTAFWALIFCFTTGCLLLCLPTVSILQRLLKYVIFLSMGPWMKFFDSTNNYHDYSANKKKQKSYQQRLYKQSQNARLHQEESCKLKAMRQFRFGPYMTGVNDLSHPGRHLDIPLCDSMALHQSLVPSLCPEIIPTFNSPSQTLIGNMTYSTSEKQNPSPAELNRQKRRQEFVKQWTQQNIRDAKEEVEKKRGMDDQEEEEEEEEEESKADHETISTVTFTTPQPNNNDNNNCAKSQFEKSSTTTTQTASITIIEQTDTEEEDTLAVPVPVKHVLTSSPPWMMTACGASSVNDPHNDDEQRHDSTTTSPKTSMSKSSLGKRMDWDPYLQKDDDKQIIELDDYGDDDLLSGPYEHADDEEGVEVVRLDDDDDDEDNDKGENETMDNSGVGDTSTTLSCVYQSSDKKFITYLHRNKNISTVTE